MGPGFGLRTECAFVIGYSGAVGRHLVDLLLQKAVFSKLVLIGRRLVEFPDLPIYQQLEQHLVDFDRIDEYHSVFEGVKFGYCALGTTRMTSGKDGFVKVDHDYIVNSAKVAHLAGCSHFCLVSSMGADSNSWFLYTKTKAVGFDHLSVFQPAFLEGDRPNGQLKQRILQSAIWIVKWAKPTLFAVSTASVAKAMIVDTFAESTENVRTIENPTIHELSEQFDHFFH